MARAREPIVRRIFVSDDPHASTPRLFVATKVATLLQFDRPCDPARTKMLGWEGRFEPLQVSGKFVVLMPVQHISPQDRLLLVVTLENGVELPFIVTSKEDRVDQQVDVFLQPEAPEAMRAALTDSRAMAQRLLEENKRYKEEETSVDHALAALMVKGAVEQTLFRLHRTWLLKGDDADIEVRSFGGLKKVAVVFKVTNHHGMHPWRLMEARVSTASTGEARPFALRAGQDEIAPGTSGVLAIVADESAFKSGNGSGPEKLVIDIFRSDGLQHARVVLEWRNKRE
jgi:uncharacterized protein (TIGR02268 family)